MSDEDTGERQQVIAPFAVGDAPAQVTMRVAVAVVHRFGDGERRVLVSRDGKLWLPHTMLQRRVRTDGQSSYTESLSDAVVRALQVAAPQMFAVLDEFHRGELEFRFLPNALRTLRLTSFGRGDWAMRHSGMDWDDKMLGVSYWTHLPIFIPPEVLSPRRPEDPTLMWCNLADVRVRAADWHFGFPADGRQAEAALLDADDEQALVKLRQSR